MIDAVEMRSSLVAADAYNTGYEAEIFRWSSSDINGWLERNPDLADEFLEGMEDAIEVRRNGR